MSYDGLNFLFHANSAGAFVRAMEQARKSDGSVRRIRGSSNPVSVAHAPSGGFISSWRRKPR